MSKSGENYNFYNTMLSYGLHQNEKEYVDECIEGKDFKHISCGCFEDILAVPAGIVIVRFSEFTEQERAIFNEGFSESHAAIIAVDNFPCNNHFAYFGDIDFFAGGGDQSLLLLQLLSILSKKKEATNIPVEFGRTYSVAALSEQALSIAEYRDFKFIGRKEYDLTIDEIPKKVENLVYYNPLFIQGNEICSFGDIADGFINMNLLLGCEYPMTAVMDLDAKLEYFFSEKENYRILPESDKLMLLLRAHFDAISMEDALL